MAWAVHLFTASGAVVAFLATLAVGVGDFRRAFAWLFVAVLVDASDGWLARRARVKERTPQIDGTKLDDLVDYLSFVFVPVLLMWRADLLPPGWGLIVAAIVLVASGFGFVHADAKTPDHFFTGFPSYWNIVALYLFVFGWPPPANAALLLALTVMIFVRVGYVHPSRTPVLRALTLALCVLWGATIAVVIWQLPSPPRWLVGTSLFYPIYYAALSVALHVRRG